MSGVLGNSLKRKEPEDLVRDLLNVTLSPNKKPRVLDSGVTLPNERGSNFTTPKLSEAPWGFFPATPTPTPVPSVPTVLSPPAVEEQRALVLYRPVTPPLFPGGPPVGSVDFPYKVNTAMLQIPQGTDRELTSQLDCQSALSVDKDAPSGHDLFFQALDLSGGPMSFPVPRRLNRVSSCSALPHSSLDLEDQVMVEEVDKSTELAVIPWVPMTPIVVASKSRPIIEEVDDELNEVPDADEMVDEDSMEVVNDDIIAETSATPMVGQFDSPRQSFSAAPWQTEILQAPFTQPMWSH